MFRTLRDRWTFQIGLHARLIFDVVSAIAGIALIAPNGFTLAPTDIAGAALTLIGVALLSQDLREKMRRGRNRNIADNPTFAATIEAATLAAGFERHITEAGRYITNPEVNALLEGSASPLEWEKQRYIVPEQLADYRERAISLMKPHFKDEKIRLLTDITPARLKQGEMLAVQRTNYFNGVATNEIASKRIEALNENRRGRAQLLFAPVDLVVTDGQLLDLADSALSNHIGITTLLLTADHQIVLQMQGKQMIDALKQTVGASGSLDVPDAYGKKRALRTLQDMIRHGMEREAQEEVSAAIGPGKSRTWLTGYARYLNRGGKPEFHGITRTSAKLDDLRAGKAEAGFVHQISGRPFEPSAAGLTAALDALLTETQAAPQRPSLSMIVCLRFAREYLARGGAIEF